jgi:hypothetical protein
MSRPKGQTAQETKRKLVGSSKYNYICHYIKMMGKPLRWRDRVYQTV